MKKILNKTKNFFQPANRLQVGALEYRHKLKKEVGKCEIRQKDDK